MCFTFFRMGLLDDELMDKKSTPIDTLSNYLSKRLAFGKILDCVHKIFCSLKVCFFYQICCSFYINCFVMHWFCTENTKDRIHTIICYRKILFLESMHAKELS